MEHNEDGTHKKATLTSATNPANDHDSAAPTANDSRWWRGPGAWSLDDPTATNKHVVGLRPPDPPAGTYNNYAPPGIDDAVVVEIEGAGNITLTGLKAAPNSRKRFLLLRNRDSSNSITLSDNSTSSEVQNRFDLPAVAGTAGSGALLDASHNTDTVAQAVTRGSLVYGNSTPKWDELVIGAANRILRSNGTDVSWAQAALATDVSGVLPIANGGTNSSTALSGSTIAISNGSALVQGTAGTTTTVLHGNAAGAPTYAAVSMTADVTGVLPIANGGTGSSTAGLQSIVVNLTNAQIKNLNTTHVTLVAAPGAGKILIPVQWTVEKDTTVAYGASGNAFEMQYGAAVFDGFFLLNQVNPDLNNVRSQITVGGDGARIFSDYTVRDPRNKTLEVRLAADPSDVGTSNSTARITVFYHTIDSISTQ